VLTTQEHWKARFHADGPARPTEVSLRTVNGQHTRRPVYESGHRATWRALHGALTNGSSPAYTVDDLIADITFAQSVLG